MSHPNSCKRRCQDEEFRSQAKLPQPQRQVRSEDHRAALIGAAPPPGGTGGRPQKAALEPGSPLFSRSRKSRRDGPAPLPTGEDLPQFPPNSIGCTPLRRSSIGKEHARGVLAGFRTRRANTRLAGGEGGIRTPETLPSLHALQACALNQARPPLRTKRFSMTSHR
jgi:hypothetical protein